MKIDSQTNWQTHAANLALIALILIALYWRVFFLGETVIDVKTLDNQLPWGYSAAEEVNHPYNRRDPTDMYLTREYFIVQSYRDGEVPLWNPYTMAGHPIYADGVTRIFSPFLLFYTFLDMPLGYSVARIVELLLGAVFMYLFLIAIRVSARGALLAALVFELSAHSLFHLTGLGWWGGLMWLPLIFLFVDRAITRNDFKQAILAGIFLALQFFCGYMPNQIYYIAAIALYYLFFGWRAKSLLMRAGTRIITTPRLLAMLVVTLTIGLALAATQWVPVMELLGFSNRRIVPSEAGYIYLPPWYLVTLIFPNIFGTAYDARMVTLFTALNVSHDHSLYLGIAALLPLTFLLTALWKKRRAAKRRNPETGVGEGSQAGALEVPTNDSLQETRLRFFVLFAFFALFVMMAAPIYVHATQFVPVLRSIRVIVRAGVMFIFAASVLVGFGIDALLAASKDELRSFSHYVKRFLVAVFASVAIGTVILYLARLSGFVSSGNFDYVAGSGRTAYLKSVAGALASQFAPPKIYVLAPLGLLVLAYLLLKLWQSEKIKTEAFFWALVVFLIVDLSLNSMQFDETHDRARVFPATEITDTLKSLPPGRVLVAPSGIESNRRERDYSTEEKIIAPPNTLLAYKIPTVTGKDQLFPRAYREFSALIEPQPQLSHVVFDKTDSRYFDLLNVRYLLTHASAPAPAHHQLLLEADGLALYENQKVLPRAFFVEEVVSAPSAAGVLSHLREAEFDPRKTAVREEKDGDDRHTAFYSTETAKAIIAEDRRNGVGIETENADDGLLVLSDNFYPGWRAAIDGVPAEVLRVNYTMRGVRVPKGRHMVSFAFAPRSFAASAYFSLASVVLVLVSLFVMRKKRGAAM